MVSKIARFPSILAILVICIISMAAVSPVQAPLSSLSSGFAVTTDYHERHIDEILPGTPVTAMAAFIVQSEDPLTPAVEWIQFIWRASDTMERDHREDPPFYTGTWTDKQGITHTIYYLNDTFTPTTPGPWGIQAIFRGEGGTIMGQDTADPAFSIKAISFAVVPEVPFGTIAIIVAMFGALGLFTIRKRRTLLTGKST